VVAEWLVKISLNLKVIFCQLSRYFALSITVTTPFVEYYATSTKSSPGFSVIKLSTGYTHLCSGKTWRFVASVSFESIFVVMPLSEGGLQGKYWATSFWFHLSKFTRAYVPSVGECLRSLYTSKHAPFVSPQTSYQRSVFFHNRLCHWRKINLCPRCTLLWLRSILTVFGNLLQTVCRLKVSSHSVCQPVNHTRIFIQAKVNIPLCES